ncbi:MAG TPA: hypothetical protein VGE52_14285 [Pirellulales bacterium]
MPRAASSAALLRTLSTSRSLSGLAMTACCFALLGCGREPVGAVQVYEFTQPVDLPAFKQTLLAREVKIIADTEEEQLQKAEKLLTGMVDWRINVDIKLANVKRLDDGAYEVGIYGERPDRQAMVERRLSRKGSLGFHALACRGLDDDVIAAAEATNAEEVPGKAGRIARWAKLALRSDGKPRATLDDSRLVRRTRDGRDEVLLMVDPELNVSELNLKKIFYANDDAGRIALRYWLDAPSGIALAKAGERLRRETSLPRRLGVLFEGELVDARPIDGPLGDHGIVSGIESPEDARDWVAIFTHGPLPSPMRKR